jgi:hypothetical protein
MEVCARISKEWRNRMLFMFFMFFCMAGWFLWDGYIAWPAETERYQAFSQIADEVIAKGLAVDVEDVEVRLAWERHARAEGYSSKIPKERTDSDLSQQRWIGGVMMTASLLFLGWVLWNHTRSIRAEGDLITGASGETVHLDSIVSVDRRKWSKKGIAYGIYEKGGKQRRLVLDDHKFAGAEAIVLEAERRIEARSAKLSSDSADSDKLPAQ